MHTKMSHLKLSVFLAKTVVITVPLATLKMINDTESPLAQFSQVFSS